MKTFEKGEQLVIRKNLHLAVTYMPGDVVEVIDVFNKGRDAEVVNRSRNYMDGFVVCMDDLEDGTLERMNT